MSVRLLCAFCAVLSVCFCTSHSVMEPFNIACNIFSLISLIYFTQLIVKNLIQLTK